MVVTKKFLPRFKYDKSKAEKYQLALAASLGNMWVVDLIRHLGVDVLADLLQQFLGVATESIFGNKPSKGSYRERHYYKPWFDVDFCTTKRELKLWLKANLDSHAAKHQESKLKNLRKKKGNCKSSTYVCACQGGCVLVLEKVPAKGTRCGQNQCNYAFGKLPRAS
jgi:hypothetical protein